jgi:FkbM family methyltransferase
MFTNMNRKYVGSFLVFAPHTLAGWVWNPECPDERLPYEININGQSVFKGVADKKRHDLQNAGIGDGCYAFNVSLAQFLKIGSNTIQVVCGKNAEELKGSPSDLEVSALPVFPSFEPYASSGLVIRKTKYGYMLLNTFDRGVDQAILEYGEWASDEADLFGFLLGAGDVALDVGANLGASSIPMAEAVGISGRVYSFEPQTFNFYRLCSHALLNGYSNIFPKLSAVGSGGKDASVNVPIFDYSVENLSGSVSVIEEDRPAGTMPVELISLDRFCVEQDISPTLIKIDVEGFEERVIRGAINTLGDTGASVYFEAHSLSDYQKICSLIRNLNLGYAFYWHVARIFRQDNFNGSKRDIYSGGGISFNVLATTRELNFKQPGLIPVKDGDEFWPTDRFPKMFREKINMVKKNQIKL